MGIAPVAKRACAATLPAIPGKSRHFLIRACAPFRSRPERWGLEGRRSPAIPVLERLQAKWRPVRVKKTRQIRNPAPRFDSIEAEKALAHEHASYTGSFAGFYRCLQGNPSGCARSATVRHAPAFS